MPRRSRPLLFVLFLITSCGGSSQGPSSILLPPPALVVSSNQADQPDFLCDGVEDDVEINRALRRSDSTSSRTVLLKPGTYHLMRNVIVTSGLTLRGSGPTTVLRLDDNAPTMITIAGIIRLKDDAKRGTAKRVRSVVLEDFVVDGNRANQPAGLDEKKYGFYAEGDSLVFRRLVARNCGGYGFDPHSFSDTIGTSITTIEDCESYGNALDGFVLDRVERSTFRRNHSHDNDRHGINLTGGTNGVTLSDSRSLRNGATGIVAQNGTHHVAIEACELADNGLEGVYLRDADASRLSGNRVKRNGRSGMVLRLTDSATVSGNDLADNDGAQLGYAVIVLDSASVNTVRSNSIMGATARGGVLEDGTADYNVVADNVIGVRSRPVFLIGLHSTQSGNILR
jgi:parallel beta-helix repeat protein